MSTNNTPSEQIMEDSGNVKSDSRLVSFLYSLMRDKLPAGQIEELMMKSSNEETVYCNGWLADYAINVAKRLQE